MLSINTVRPILLQCLNCVSSVECSDESQCKDRLYELFENLTKLDILEEKNKSTCKTVKIPKKEKEKMPAKVRF